MPKVLPEGIESLRIEVWGEGKYKKQITVHVDAINGFDEFVEALTAKLVSSVTVLKIKSSNTKSQKNITLHYGAAQVINEIKQVSKDL